MLNCIMPQFHKNIWIDTWIKGTLLSAIIHLSVLTILALKDRSIAPLNIFYILDIHLIFPSITQGFFSTVISAIIIVLIFLPFYLQRLKK